MAQSKSKSKSKSKTYIGSQVKRQKRLSSQRPVKVRGDFQVDAQYKAGRLPSQGESQNKRKSKQSRVKFD